MKLPNAQQPATTVGLANLETRAYTMDVSGKAFRILIDTLYTNKIRAVLRELMSNAADSHVSAGCDSMPFDVHLPTYNDPTLRVRDYGISLSDEDVMDLYTAMFRSTKDENNDVVGALGLGSKSPFCLSDQFTVIARQDGRKRTYLAMIGDDGIPTLTRLSDVESDEARGFEVSMAVNTVDIPKFEHEMRSLAVGFDPVPDVDGMELTVPEPVYMAKDGSFAVFNNEDLPGDNKVSVRQGWVIYPVDNPAVTERLTSLVNYGYKVVLNVPIGSVNIAASREALGFDEVTTSFVRTACGAAADLLTNEIATRADQCDTELEALEFWYGADSDEDPFRAIFTITPRYRGKVLKTAIIFDRHPLWTRMSAVSGAGNIKERRGNEFKGLDYTHMRNVRIILTRTPDQDKVVREATRVKNLIDGLTYQEKLVTFICHDMPVGNLRIIMQMTGLKLDRIIRTRDLEDPGPPARFGTTRVREKGELQGITDVTNGLGYTPVKVKELPRKFFWFEVARTTSREVDYKVSKLQQIESFTGSFGIPILSFTPGAVAKHSPDEAWNLMPLVDLWHKENFQKVLDVAIEVRYRSLMRGAGLESEIPASTIDVSKANVAESLIYQRPGNWHDHVRSQAEKKMSVWRDKYPLLFNPRDAAARADYISMCNQRNP